MMTGDVCVIFYADDDEDDRDLFRMASEDFPLQVSLKLAANGAELIESLRKTDVMPKVIVLDVNMPIVNGIACLKQIREMGAYKHVPVIMFSTGTDEYSINESKLLGANHYVAKPQTIGKLKDMLILCIEVGAGRTDKPYLIR